ncbi:DUF2474 family protein [Roseomonas terrae]|jgi:hypothetical protein|uniref:DUF2474 family protein n=1 Tax=Neoroseomonas terrae TaxID=424799 RepID=A0ABS5EDL8_9PROT|nr:DUF2474 family protein [Neoroseomonas terrae]MBR0649113.1 DUF2474 family protein [Neoroseomonas terrae]
MPGTKPLAARIGWFVLIWAASVLALGVVGLLIKVMLR